MLDAGAVDGVPGGEIVRAVEHHVGRRHLRLQRLAFQALLQGNDFHFRIDQRQRVPPRAGLGPAHVPGVMQHLALQVGEIHRVAVAQHQGADAGCGQVQGRRRAQAAGTHDQGPGSQKLLLAFDAQLVEQDMAAVTQELLVVHWGVRSEA